MSKLYKKIIIFLFYLIMTLPLLKPNISSIAVIIFTIFSIPAIYKSKFKIKDLRKYLFLTIPFFLFLFHEVFSKSFNEKTVLLGVPFLVFPLIIFFKPYFITIKNILKSLVVFQISTLLQCIIYLVVFLKSNHIIRLLDISNENIPFFREFVTANYLKEMHPTYFSSFLLFSITISLFNYSKNRVLHTINFSLSIFFILLFSSRVIIIIMLLTLFSFIILCLNKRIEKKIYKTLIFVVISLSFLYVFKLDVVNKRFIEIKNHINKPIVGNYYNSTNTRVAIYKCNVFLMEKLPFWGYGDSLQKELNDCYEETNDSNFYKLNIYNTHNYYFHMLLYGGWIYLLIFFIFLFYLFIKIKSTLLYLFIFIQFILVNLTENYLSRHYGVFLFCYFTAIFIFINEQRNTRIKQI